jgi:hypothetical protein
MTTDDLLAALERFFGDTSRPREDTLDGLNAFGERLDQMIGALMDEMGL